LNKYPLTDSTIITTPTQYQLLLQKNKTQQVRQQVHNQKQVIQYAVKKQNTIANTFEKKIDKIQHSINSKNSVDLSTQVLDLIHEKLTPEALEAISPIFFKFLANSLKNYETNNVKAIRHDPDLLPVCHYLKNGLDVGRYNAFAKMIGLPGLSTVKRDSKKTNRTFEVGYGDHALRHNISNAIQVI
jgi:hypothetical protein